MAVAWSHKQPLLWVRDLLSSSAVRVLMRTHSLLRSRQGRAAVSGVRAGRDAHSCDYAVHRDRADAGLGRYCHGRRGGAERTLARGEPEHPLRLSSCLCSECTSQSVLLAVARLSFDRDDLRRRIAEEKLTTKIVAYLRSSSIALRVAACECVRSISRSANMLRIGLADAGATDPLFERLSKDEVDRVRVVATAAVSNLLTDYSPMKEVRHLVSSARSGGK